MDWESILIWLLVALAICIPIGMMIRRGNDLEVKPPEKKK